MELTAQELFFFIIVVMAILGFMRGWRREVLALAFLLGAILFLAVGGGTWMADLLFVRLPFAFGNTSQVPPSPSASTIGLTTIITFAVIVAIGYLVGNRVFPKPTLPVDRIMGIIPGIIGGIAIYVLIANTSIGTFIKNINLQVGSPDQGVIGNSLLLLFLVVIAVVIIGLVAANSKKSAPKK